MNDALQQMLTRFLAFIPDIIASVVIFFGSLVLAGFIAKGIRKAMSRRANAEITLAVMMIARWTIVILGTSTALEQVGFNLTAFLAGVGIVGFTVGFALQDVSKNFIAGLLLLLQQPFELGDVIEVAGFTGTVLKIDLRATEMRALDGRMVQIPNGDVFTSPIVNFTRADRRRVELTMGIGYDADLSAAREVALAAIHTLEGVLQDPAPRAIFQNSRDASLKITLHYWVDSKITDMLDAQDAGLLAVNEAFIRAGIEIPLPTHAVVLQQKESNT